MSYDIFEPTMTLPPSVKMKVKVKKEHFEKSKAHDALKNPIALCIKQYLKNGDVLATSKLVLYYDRKFDRKNHDIILGEGRIAMIPISEEISKRVRDYQETGKIIPFDFEIYIPKLILDDSHK